MSKPYYPPCFIEEDIKAAEAFVVNLRPFPSTLPPVEWKKEMDIQGFTAPMQGDHMQFGRKPDGSWFMPEGTVCHHRQIELRFTNHFRGRRQLTYLGSDKKVNNPLCHILFHPRAADNLVITEMDAAMKTPRVEQALAAFEKAKADLRETTQQIEARCKEIDPGYEGLVLGFEGSRAGAAKEGLRSKLFAVRERVEDSYYDASCECQRELEKTKKELLWARNSAWCPPRNNHNARMEISERVKEVLIRTLRNHGVHGFEKKGSRILKGMVQGLMAGTFALYELAPQEQTDDASDDLGWATDSKHRPLEFGLDTLIEAIRSENMNCVHKPGHGYFAFCVSTHGEREERQNQYQSTQSVCLVGRVFGEKGGWAMILPLILWRTVIMSADIYLYHELPEKVFGYTGHIWLEKDRKGNEVIRVRNRRPSPKQDDRTEQEAEDEPSEDASSDEPEDPDGAEEPPPESDGETEDGPSEADGGPVNGEDADADSCEAATPAP